MIGEVLVEAPGNLRSERCRRSPAISPQRLQSHTAALLLCGRVAGDSPQPFWSGFLAVEAFWYEWAQILCRALTTEELENQDPGEAREQDPVPAVPCSIP